MDVPAEIAQLLTSVSPAERDALLSRFGLDRGAPRSFKEASEHLGVDVAEVKRLERSAIEKLRVS